MPSRMSSLPPFPSLLKYAATTAGIWTLPETLSPVRYTGRKIKKTIARFVTRGRMKFAWPSRNPMKTPKYSPSMNPWQTPTGEPLPAIKNRFQIPSDISLDLLCTKNGIIETADPEIDTDNIWRHLEKCLETALSDFDAMKTNEGAALKQDLDARLKVHRDPHCRH